MDLEGIDFDQICRTCRNVAPYMRSIFEGYQNARESPPINEMLMACASVQVVAGDGLPSQICQICVEQLNNAFIFKHQCEKSDSSLREYAKSMKVNEIKEELQSSDFMESLCAISNLLDEQQPSLEETPLNGVTPLVDPKIEQTFLTTPEDFSCHECTDTGNVCKCKHCDKEYTRLNQPQHHKPSHNRKKVYVCKICKKIWKKLGHVKEHLTTHLREKLFSCKTCNRGFNRLQRLQIHTPKCKGNIVYRCEICNKNFNRKKTFEMHKKTHDNQQPILLTIENLDNIEDYYYKINEDAILILSDHSNVSDCFEPQIEVSESMDEDKTKDISNTTQDNDSETSAVVVIDNDNCSNVDEGTNDSIESKIDIKKEVEEEEMLIEVKADEDDGNADIVEILKVYNCKLCNKKFNEAGNLKRHVISHSAVKPFKCTVCTKSFNKSIYLNKHQKLHQRQNDFECDVCQKSFSQADYLAKHKASKHVIGKKTLAKRKYKKQYQCSECGQIFVRNDYLVVHMRRHRGEKPFKCKYCGKGFPRSTDLTVHERRHTGEKTDLCMICGKGFGRAYSLTIHMRTHTGEKPYQCTYCDAAFAQGGDLKSHLRRHTGEKYECKLCMTSFRSRRMLSQHKRTIHDESKCSISAEMSVNKEEQLIQSELPESS